MDPEIDTYFYMMGDEDGGVGLRCRFCNRGGAPVVYITPDLFGAEWENTNVIVVNDIITVNNIINALAHATKHIERHRIEGNITLR